MFNPSPNERKDGDAAPAFSARVQLSNTLVPDDYNYIALAQTSTTDVWTFRKGGAGGTLVATLTIVYTDSTKATISTVTKT